jgi:serine protease Do
VITRFNGKEITNEVSLRNAISSSAPGSVATITVRHEGGQVETLTATLTTPQETASAAPTPAPARRPANNLGFEPRPLTAEILSSLKLSPNTKGVVISSVVPGSPAAEAGLRSALIVNRVNGTPVSSPAALNTAIASAKSGDIVTLGVLIPSEDGSRPSQAVVNITVP